MAYTSLFTVYSLFFDRLHYTVHFHGAMQFIRFCNHPAGENFLHDMTAQPVVRSLFSGTHVLENPGKKEMSLPTSEPDASFPVLGLNLQRDLIRWEGGVGSARMHIVSHDMMLQLYPLVL